MRSGSRLLSGAAMEDGSMLLEHTLLTSGEIAESGGVYAGWPAHRLDQKAYLRRQSSYQLLSAIHLSTHYRKLQRVNDSLAEEKRKLERKIEKHQRELHEAKRKLDMLQVSDVTRLSLIGQ